jgi:ADP-heptose:LPS heptosyltransferase
MIKLWGIGNLVMILPLIRAVRRHYPHAEIHFLTLEHNAGMLQHVAGLDRLITFEPAGLVSALLDLLRTLGSLRKNRYELVLDFEQFLKVSPLMAGLSGAAQTIGFRTEGQARHALYNVKVPYRRDRHMSLTFGDIVRSAGISTEGLPPVEVPRSETAAAQAAALLPRGRGPVVALHVGSGDNFPGRRWPVDRFADLARRLTLELDARCVVTGTASEEELARTCIEKAGVPMVDATGRLDILPFIEFLNRVDLLVTNDTAPAHLSSALGVPVVAIYGPNTPDLYGPLHLMSRVLYHRLPCSPCLTNLNAKTSRCRIPSCILEITTDQAFEAAKDLLRSGREVAP